MATRYDVISSRWSTILGKKYTFFQLLSTIKVNIVAKTMQSVIYMLFLIKHKELPFLAVLT